MQYIFSLKRRTKKILYFYFVFIIISNISFGQTISGKVIDALNDKPLIYVSIGVIGTSKGTITNEEGVFIIETKELSNDSLVRFSMIGYESQSFKIKDLTNKVNIIKLTSKPYQLSEVVVKSSGKSYDVGATSFSRFSGVCGWGGTDFGRGHEIGSEIDLGNSFVQIKSLHVRLYKQSYDSTLFRLHIRNISENVPSSELLNKDIYIFVNEENGWVNIDLSQYNLIFKDKIAISLEWIKVFGINEKRFIKMNGSKNYTANVLFNLNNNKGTFFVRKGSEAKWSRYENQSPSFYLTLQE